MTRTMAVLILLSLILTIPGSAPPTASQAAGFGIKYRVQGDVLRVETLLLDISIDLGNGGIVREVYVKPLGARLVGARKTAGGVVAALFMDIIPPGKPVENPGVRGDWPGEAIGRRAGYRIVRSGPYTLSLDVYYALSYPRDVEVRKRYTFYYDKYFFDTEYVFINNHTSRVEFWLDSFSRDTGFGVEVVTKYGSSHMDDYQEITFTNNTGKLYNPPISHWDPRYGGQPFYADASITSIGLLAGPGNPGLKWPASDYGLAAICFPLDKASVGATYAAWFEIAVDTSQLVARLEMRRFAVAPGAQKAFTLRFYTGPLYGPVLVDAGLETLSRLLGDNNLLPRTPQPPGGYGPGPHAIDVSISLEGGFDMPAASIIIEYLSPNSTYIRVGEYPIDSLEKKISVDESGLYRIYLDKTEGLTVEKKYMFSVAGISVNDRFYPNSSVIVPVYKDVSLKIKFALTPVAHLTIRVLDENDVPRNDIAGTLQLAIARQGGGVQRYRLTGAEDSLYVIAGDSTVYVFPRNYGNLTLRYIYYDDVIVFTDGNDTHVWFRQDITQGEHRLEIYYGAPPAPGQEEIPETVYILLTGVTAAVFAVLIMIALKRRRY